MPLSKKNLVEWILDVMDDDGCLWIMMEEADDDDDDDDDGVN